MARTPVTVFTYPQSLQARQIISVGPADSKTSAKLLRLAGGAEVIVSGAQITAFSPVAGDYYVVPAEGNPYLVAKSTFGASYTAGG